MSDLLRFELTGKNADEFNRVFQKLACVIISGMSAIIPEEAKDFRHGGVDILADVAEISKNWVMAKVERAGLENERIVGEITNLFEDAKLKRAQRQKQEIENESLKLDLAVKQVETAIRLLGLLNNHVLMVNGQLTVVLTNQSLTALNADMKAISQNIQGTISDP